MEALINSGYFVIIFLRLLSYVLIFISMLILLSWSDSDCIYTSEVILQMRLCGSEYLDGNQSDNYLLLLSAFIALIAGVVLFKATGKYIE